MSENKRYVVKPASYGFTVVDTVRNDKVIDHHTDQETAEFWANFYNEVPSPGGGVTPGAIV